MTFFGFGKKQDAPHSHERRCSGCGLAVEGHHFRLCPRCGQELPAVVGCGGCGRCGKRWGDREL